MAYPNPSNLQVPWALPRQVISEGPNLVAKLGTSWAAPGQAWREIMLSMPTVTTSQYGCGSKLNRRGYAGFGPCFHAPRFDFGTGFLSHSHITVRFQA